MCVCVCAWLTDCADVRRDRERIPQRKPRAGQPTAASAASTASATAASHNDSQQPGQPHLQSAAAATAATAAAGGSSSPDVPRTSAQDIASSGPASSADGGGAGSVGDGSELYGSSYTNRRTREADILHDIVRQTRRNFIDVANNAAAAAPAPAHSEPAAATTAGAAAGARYATTGERLAEEREERSRAYTAGLNKRTQLAADDRGDRDRKESGTTAAAASHLSSSLLTSSLLASPPTVVSLLSMPLPSALLAFDGSANAALAELMADGSIRTRDRHWLLSQSQLVSAAVAEAHIAANPGKLVLAFDELQLPAS